MIFPTRCPKCRSQCLAVEVETWVDVVNGKPTEFDPDDAPYATPKPHGEAICCNCQHQWRPRLMGGPAKEKAA